MELYSDQNKNIQKLINDHNLQVQKLKIKSQQINNSLLYLDTSFGINSNPICNQLQIIGDKYVIFMIGNILVIRDILDKTQKFYSYQNRFQNVTALYGVSKEQKYKDKIKKLDQDKKPIYLADTPPIKIYLAQSSQHQDKTANIVLLKPYKNKIRVMSAGIRGVIKQLTVDRSKKLCACLLQSVNSYVLVFNYRKQRLLTCTSLKIPSIENLSIHPLKQKSVILMGRNYLRLWELHSQESLLKQSQQLVPLKTQKQNRFYDFSWQNNNKNPLFFVLSSQNKVLVIQNDSLIKTLELGNKDQFYSIVVTKRGFCVGGSNKALSLYQLDKSLNLNLLLGSSGVPLKSNQNNHKIEDCQDKIIRIHNSQNDGFFTVVTTNQIGSFNFYYLNTFRIDADISSLDQFFPSGFHNKKINCLSRSVTKQLMASCSEDNTVKIWNFFDVEGYQKKGLISHSFHQEPLSVSMHPSGLFLAVSFNSGFKTFAIVNDTLEVLKDIQIPNCKLVKYSHGGHFLAVNQKQHIFIYDSIYYETLHLFSLTNHVQELTISHDDTHIIATCTSGYVYCFNLYDSIHNKDYHSKKGFDHKQSAVYNCIAYGSKITVIDKNDKTIETDLFVGCTTEKYMVIYKNKCKKLVAEFPIVNCHVTSLLICPLQKILLVGTSKGTLRVYQWPLDQNAFQWIPCQDNPQKVKLKQAEFLQINAHSYPLVAMIASHDQNYLFTGSQDGTILCFKMLGNKQRQKKQGYSLVKPQDRKRIAQSANDLYLERVDRIEEKNQTIKKLKFEILRSEKKLKLQKQKLQIIYRQKIETLRKEYKITLETNKKIKESYIQNSTKEYQDLAEKLQNEKKKYSDQLSKLKKSHQDKIQYQEKRNQNLKAQIQALHKKHASQLQELKILHQKSMKNAKFDFFQKCNKLQIKYSNFLNQSKKNSQQFASQLSQKQKQYQNQIELQIRAKKQQIAKVKAINEQLQQKNRKLTLQSNRLKQQDQKQQQNYQQLFKQHNDIRFQNLKSDQDILKMQHQLLERLQVIQSKQQTCKNARYQQTTLENFRYMLDSKIQSLEEKKLQMIQKIKSRQNDLKSMFNQLIKESQENQKKSFQLKQLNVTIQVLQKQIKEAEQEIQGNQNKIKFFKTQVSSIANSNQDIKNVGKKLKKLVDQCQKSSTAPQVQQDNGDNGQSTRQVNDQLNRQAQWMQKKLKMVKDIAQNYKQMRQQNINNVLAQNTKLIQQCNKLRDLNDQFKKNIKQYQKQIGDLLRKKDKNIQIKKQQQTINFKGINKKLQENQAKISDQQKNLQSISEEVKQILRYKSQAKFPNLNKRKL